MSEFEGLAAGTGPSGGAGVAGEVADYARRNAYWAVVGRAYWRGAMTRVASWWVVLLIVIAVAVPFMANSRPLVMRAEKGGWEYPLVRDLGRVDWILLTWGAAALVYLFVHRRIGKRVAEIEAITAARMRWFAGIFVTCILASVSYGMPVEELVAQFVKPHGMGAWTLISAVVAAGVAAALFILLSAMGKSATRGSRLMAGVGVAGAACVLATLPALLKNTSDQDHLTRILKFKAAYGAIVVCGVVAAYGAVRDFAWANGERGSRVKMAAALSVVAVAVLASIGLNGSDFLEKRDFPALRRAGELKGAVYAPLKWGFADQEPLEQDRVFEGPTRDHWLGTDGVGRDALARVLWGTRIVLGIGLVSEVIALAIGVVYGAMMGYFVGKVDMLGMRFVEIVESIPQLFLLITFIALYGRSLFMLMVVIGLTSWTGIARFVRAEFLQLRNLDYVTAAKAMGLPLHRILFRHMLPNGLTPVIVTFTFGVASNVVSESILSFLGIGVEPPTPSWGSMLNEAGNPAEIFRWWLAIAPGLMIFLTVFAYNTIGEGLRDAIDPKTNKIE